MQCVFMQRHTFSSDDFFSAGFSSDAASSLSADFFFSDFTFFVL